MEVKGYKVFNSDWTCSPNGNTKQYVCPGLFEEDVAPIGCVQGMHFCRKAVDCFNYYSFSPDNKVAEVIAYGDIAEEDDKCCTNKLKIVREIPWGELLDIVNTGKGCTGNRNSGDRNSGENPQDDGSAAVRIYRWAFYQPPQRGGFFPLPGQAGREREWDQHWDDSQAAEDCREGRIFGGAGMREILFKAKRVGDCKWVQGQYVNCWNPNNHNTTGHFIVEYPGTLHEIYTNTLCQYTGLTDKNGVKIFEGDVVVLYKGEEYEKEAFVSLKKACWVIELKKHGILLVQTQNTWRL